MPQTIPLLIAGGWGATALVTAIVIDVVIIGGAMYMAAEQKKAMNRMMKALDQAAQQVQVQNDGIVPQAWPYGRVRVGGCMLDQWVDGADNSYLCRIHILAGCEIDAVEQVYFDNVPVFNTGTYQQIWTGTGAPGQTIPAAFGNGRWNTSTDRLDGMAYVAYRLKYDPKNNRFPTGAPQVSALIRGRKVKDIRTGTYGWSKNPVLCAMDYMQSSSMNVADDFFTGYADEIIASANVCDESITTAFAYTRDWPLVAASRTVDVTDVDRTNLYVGQYISGSGVPANTYVAQIYTTPVYEDDPDDTGGKVWSRDDYYVVLSNEATTSGTQTIHFQETEPRYSFDGVVWRNTPHKNVLESLKNSMSGLITETGGQWVIQAGYYKSPAITLTQDDVLSDGISIQTHADKSEVFNCVKPSYVSAAAGYIATEAPPITSSFFKERDGEELWQTIELPYCTSPIQAQRHAKIALLHNRLDLGWTATFPYGAIRARVGDTIKFNHTRYGWQDAVGEEAATNLFVVLGVAINYDNMTVQISAKKTSPDIYDWQVSDEKFALGYVWTKLADPSVVSSPFNIDIAAGTEELRILPDGTIIPQAHLTWQTTGSVQSVEIWAKKQDDSSWNLLGNVPADNTSFTTAYVEQGETCDFGLVGVNSFGARSTMASASAYIYGKTLPPNPPTNFRVEEGFGTITARWNEPADADYYGTKVYVGPNSTFSETYLNTTTAADSAVINLSSSLARQHVWVRGLDTTWNTSSLVGPITASANVTSIKAADLVVTILADFGGNVSNWATSNVTTSLTVNGSPAEYYINLGVLWPAWNISGYTAVNCTRNTSMWAPSIGITAMTDDEAHIFYTASYKQLSGKFTTAIGRVDFKKIRATTPNESNYYVTSYGAIGDGTTNDTTAIQAAINAAHAAGGGTVVLPTGTYLTDTITLKSNVTVKGTGWDSVIKANSNQRIVQAGGFSTNLVNAALLDLKIDGQLRNHIGSWNTGSPVGTVQGIGLEVSSSQASNITIDNVYVYDTRLEGLYANNIAVHVKSMKAEWCGGYAGELDGSGIALDNCPNSVIDYMDGTNVRGQFGIVVQSSTGNVTIHDFTVTNPVADGLCVRGARFVNILGGRATNVGQRGINIRGDVDWFGECSDITVSNVYLENSIGGYDGVSVYQASRITVRDTTTVTFDNAYGFEGGASYGNSFVFYPTYEGCANLNNPSSDQTNVQFVTDVGNKTYYQPTTPAGTVINEGDTWYDTDDSNKRYIRNGGSWVVVPTATASYSTVAQTAASASWIAASNIAGTIAAAQVALIPTTQLSGTIVDVQISSLVASKVTGQLTNTQIADLATSKLTGQVTNAQIADVATTKLTGTITNTQISDGAISTPKLQANSVTGNIIAANTITAKNLVLADTHNVWPDVSPRTGSFWTTTNGTAHAVPWFGTGSGGSPDGWGIYWDGSTNTTATMTSEWFVVKSGAQYNITLTRGTNQPNNTTTMYVEWSDGTTTTIDPSATSWDNISSNFTVPTSSNKARLKVTRTVSGGSAAEWFVVGIYIRERATAALIVDGAIIAGKVAAGAITAGTVAANAITGSNIIAGSITSNHITVANLSAISAKLGQVEIDSTSAITSSGYGWGGTGVAGFGLGYNAGAYKLEVGSSTDYLRWNGSNLKVAVGSGYNAVVITGSKGLVVGSVDGLRARMGSHPTYGLPFVSVGSDASPMVVMEMYNIGGTDFTGQISVNTTLGLSATFGPGGLSFGDTNLYRSAANVLKTDDAFTVGGSVLAVTPSTGDAVIGGGAGSSADRVRYQATIPTVGTWYWGADGADAAKWKLAWNSHTFAAPTLTATTDGKLWIGSVGDTNLYRSAANYLKTDDNLVVAGASFLEGTIYVGSSDVNLYRSAANTLKTDDSFTAAGDISATGYMWAGYAVSTATAGMKIGGSRSGNGYALLDLIGDTTYTDYGFRIIRYNSGANAPTGMTHRGTGELFFSTSEEANMDFYTNSALRMQLQSNGNLIVNGITNTTGKVRNINFSTSTPSGGVDGDMWVQHDA